MSGDGVEVDLPGILKVEDKDGNELSEQAKMMFERVLRNFQRTLEDNDDTRVATRLLNRYLEKYKKNPNNEKLRDNVACATKLLLKSLESMGYDLVIATGTTVGSVVITLGAFKVFMCTSGALAAGAAGCCALGGLMVLFSGVTAVLALFGLLYGGYHAIKRSFAA